MPYEKNKTSVRSLEVLHNGIGAVDKTVLTYHQGAGTLVELCYSVFLIRTEVGNVIFDTGFNPDDMPFLTSIRPRLKVKEEDFLPSRLREAGLRPEDIDTVILSHMHWDHVGYLKAVSHAEIIAQRIEHAFAFDAPAFAHDLYIRTDYDIPGLRWKLIDGDEVIMPGLTAIFTPGHSPGHQSLLVELPESGAIILASDCGFIMENFEKEIISGSFVSPTDALHSIKRLKVLAQMKNAKIVPTHDMDVWKTLKKPPESYR